MKYGGFFQKAREAGKHGVISRSAWTSDHVVVVQKLEVRENDQVSLNLIEISPNSCGNFEPQPEDLTADWYVVARSINRFKASP